MATTKVHAVEAELLKATKQKAQGPKESRQDFLGRLATAIADDDFPPAAYKKLSEAATTWYENAVAVVEADGDKAVLPDYAEETKKKFSIGSKKGVAAKTPAKKEEKKPAAKGKTPAKPEKEVKHRDKKPMRWENVVKDKVGYRSMIDAVRHIICTAPKLSITFETMKEKLEARGFTKTNEFRLYANYIQVTQTIAMLQELGKL